MSDTLQEREGARQRHERIGGEYRCNKCRTEFKTIPDFDKHKCVNEHQVTKSGTCVIPGCPCRGWSAQERANVRKESTMGDITTVSTCNKCGDSYRESLVFRHECRKEVSQQPAARGGGDGEHIRQVQKRVEEGNFCINERLEDPYNLSTRLDDTEYLLNQHQALVAERERLERMLAAVVNAHYGLAYRSIGSGDGIPEKEAAEIGRWWLDYTASDA